MLSRDPVIKANPVPPVTLHTPAGLFRWSTTERRAGLQRISLRTDTVCSVQPWVCLAVGWDGGPEIEIWAGVEDRGPKHWKRSELKISVRGYMCVRRFGCLTKPLYSQREDRICSVSPQREGWRRREKATEGENRPCLSRRLLGTSEDHLSLRTHCSKKKTPKKPRYPSFCVRC